MLRLLPREERFFNLFEEQGRNVVGAAGRLREVVFDFSDSPAKSMTIKELEHAGDVLTHDLIRTINTTFVTPFDREDVYALASRLDDVLDLIEAASDRLVLYRIKEPTSGARAFADVIVNHPDGRRDPDLSPGVAEPVDRLFRRRQLVPAAGYSLGHGTNDAQKTMGIIAGLLFATGHPGPAFDVPMGVVLSARAASARRPRSLMLIGTAVARIPVSPTHTSTGPSWAWAPRPASPRCAGASPGGSSRRGSSGFRRRRSWPG